MVAKNREQVPSVERPLLIVQLTDSHLRRDSAGKLLGMNTRDSLAAVLSTVQTNHPRPDLIIASGDIAQDGSSAAYQYFADSLRAFDCPAYWFAGNHDSATNLQAVAGEATALRRAEVFGSWLLVFMNSAVSGQVHGFIGLDDLRWLNQMLSCHPDKHVLISFHHHPVDIGSVWLDNIGLKNRDQFWHEIRQFTQVKAILIGHVHQFFDEVVGGVRVLATPSTCVQFLPNSKEFSIDSQSPGYRWLELYDDGSIATDVIRATDFSFDVDMDSDGY
jgi:Icc protein